MTLLVMISVCLSLWIVVIDDMDYQAMDCLFSVSGTD